MNRIVLVIGAIVGIPLILVLALGFGHDPNVIESPLVGKPAPPFVLRDFDGNTVRFTDLVGRPVVLNFWASWCQPCVIEHPHLVDAARRFAGRVHFVGVVPPEDREGDVDGFLTRFGGAWGPTYHDRDGKVAIAYGVFKLPETYFIDAEGRIAYKHAGPLDPDTIDRKLGELL